MSSSKVVWAKRFGNIPVLGTCQSDAMGVHMDLQAITGNLGDYTKDCILITKAEPLSYPGPEIVWCNTGFTEMTGYTLDEIRGQHPRIFQGKDTCRQSLNEISEAIHRWEPVVKVVKNYTKAGEPYYAELSIVPVADEKGWFHYWVSVHRDVTARVEQEQRLRERNDALLERERILNEEKIQLSGIAAVVEHTQDLISITDTDFRILWANKAFIQKSGYPAAAVRGSLHWELLGKSKDQHGTPEVAQRVIDAGDLRDNEVQNLNRFGIEYWTDVRISLQRDEQGRAARFVIVERDVTQQRQSLSDLKRTQRDIEIAAIRDPLTGILNRRGLELSFDAMARNAERLGHGIGVLHIDLDHFKQINDTLGHAAGDAVLVEVTDRLQAYLGPESFVARIGGDEFVIAVEMHHPDQDLQLFSDRLIKEIVKPVRYDKADCRFSASIGYSQKDAAPFSGDTLLTEADIALYRAKRGGRSRAHGFTQELVEETRHKKTLADQLSIALENGDLLAYYQPQFDAWTGALVGAEALVRWDHPERGLVGPAYFISIARELNMEQLIDRQILIRSQADFAAMLAGNVPVPKVSVNVSSRRLRHPGLIEELDTMSLSPGRLSFELLESTFLDDSDSQTLWTLDALRERGIGIEIDDFGTGHASIMGLIRVAPDRLKTDRSLLSPAIGDQKMKQLFALAIQIGNTLGIDVTAEGVESETHAELARNFGCRALQGFHFAKPMPLEDLIARYAQQKSEPQRVAG